MSENNYYSSGAKSGKLKILITVLWIMLAAVIAAGGVYTYIYINSLENKNTIAGEPAEQDILNANVLLCVVDEDNDDISPQFLLVGFDGQAKSITVCEIPSSLKIVASDRTDTVKNLFDYGSARYLRDALVNYYGTHIDRLIRCSLSEVEIFVDTLGGIDYNISEPMQQKNKDGNLVTNLVKGRQKLNGNQYCQYLRFNGWKNDNEKAKKRENLFVTLLNEYNQELDQELIINIYKKVSNKLETDISIIEMNDFSLKFNDFKETEVPARSAEIDFKDSEIDRVKIEKFYK